MTLARRMAGRDGAATDSNSGLFPLPHVSISTEQIMTIISPSRLGVVFGALGLALMATAGGTFAQANYPNHPIKLIVGFAPGGGSDFIARLVSTRLHEKLGQPVIVDNKPGAGGNLGAEVAIKSPAPLRP